MTAQNNAPKTPAGILRKIKISDIYPNPDQPRKQFNEEAIAELADSINQVGLMQPIVVTERDGGYMIVSGERRWRAHLRNKSTHIQAIVKKLNDQSVAEMAIIENLQRRDITLLEQAQAYQDMLDKGFASSGKELASRLGVKPWHITESIVLLKLIPEAQYAIENRKLTQSQARYIAALPTEKQPSLLKLCLSGKCGTPTALSVAWKTIKKPPVVPTAQSTLDFGSDVERSNRIAEEHRQAMAKLSSSMSLIAELMECSESIPSRESGQLIEMKERLDMAKGMIEKLSKKVEEATVGKLVSNIE